MIFGIIGVLLLAGVLLSKISWGWGVLGAIFLYFPATRFWTKYKAASNAILAHHTFNLLPESDRKKVLVAVSAIMSNAKYPIQDPEQELNSMASEQRYGFLALGMARIGIAPKIGGGWYDVRNPYAEILGAHREIAWIKHQIRLKYGVDVDLNDVVTSTEQRGGSVPQSLAAAQCSKQPALPKDNDAILRQASGVLDCKTADQGEANAQFQLGDMYEQGQGVPQDYEEAAKWYRLAADQGNANAQDKLGGMYYCGRGVPQDYEEAAKWYRLAADQGHELAQIDLAGMCSEGQCAPQVHKKIEVGTAAAVRPAAPWPKAKPAPQYEKEAVDSLCKSAAQGDPRAQLELGEMYRLGRGVEENFEQALYWLTKSAEQGDAMEQVWIGDLQSGGINQNHEQAVYWYRKAAEQGNSAGQCKLGRMYSEGRGVEQDDEQAVYWFKLAAGQYNPTGQYDLGNMYRDGRGVEKNIDQALELLRQAADQGVGAKELGDMYSEGHGVEKNAGEARYWYSVHNAYNAR